MFSVFVNSCLDHIFVNSTIPEKAFKFFIFRTDITDHSTVALMFDLDKQSRHESPSSTSKAFGNYPKLKDDLKKEEWTNVYDGNNNTDQMTTEFINTVTYYIQKIKKKWK